MCVDGAGAALARACVWLAASACGRGRAGKRRGEKGPCLLLRPLPINARNSLRRPLPPCPRPEYMRAGAVERGGDAWWARPQWCCVCVCVAGGAHQGKPAPPPPQTRKQRRAATSDAAFLTTAVDDERGGRLDHRGWGLARADCGTRWLGPQTRGVCTQESPSTLVERRKAKQQNANERRGLWRPFAHAAPRSLRLSRLLLRGLLAGLAWLAETDERPDTQPSSSRLLTPFLPLSSLDRSIDNPQIPPTASESGPPPTPTTLTTPTQASRRRLASQRAPSCCLPRGKQYQAAAAR